MNEKQRLKWVKFRKLGKKKYIIKIGVLYWGVFTGLFWSIFMHIFQPSEQWYIRPIIALILFPIGGIFFGIWTWKINEKKI